MATTSEQLGPASGAGLAWTRWEGGAAVLDRAGGPVDRGPAAVALEAQPAVSVTDPERAMLCEPLGDDGIALGRPRRAGPRLGRVLGLSLAGSLVVHGAIAAGAAAFVLRLAMSGSTPAREVFIEFDRPGTELDLPSSPPLAVATAEARAVAESAETAPAEARTESATEMLPRTAPLEGLSTASAEAVRSADRGVASPPRMEAVVLETPEPTASPGGSVTFAGLGASSARSVVYVVDASGPMVTSLPRVVAEVERSIGRLSPTQKFGVVLFRGGGKETLGGAGEAEIETFAPVLMRATPSAKKMLREWLGGVSPRGASTPMAGLEAAMALRPDAVFLLSRSIERSGGGVWGGGLSATMERLDRLNPVVDRRSGQRAMLIQTIQFIDDDSTGIMQAIGRTHGRAADQGGVEGAAGYRVVRKGEEIGGP